MDRILIVEDDLSIRWSLKQLLQNTYIVYEAETAEAAMLYVREHNFDLCLIDINLPGKDGYGLCQSIRANSIVPIIFITVKDDEDSIVYGLDCGADDYIVKPFSVRELESRIRAQLRHRNYQSGSSTKLRMGDYILDSDNFYLSKNNHIMQITKREFDIIFLLMQRNGGVVTRTQMLYKIWDIHDNYIEDNSLSVYISRLRKKLTQEFGQCPIETVPRIGYRWKSME